MKKKHLLLLLIVVLAALVALTGCSRTEGDADAPAKDASAATADVLQFHRPADDALVAVFHTGKGEFSAVLYPEAAPQAVQNFATLARQEAYDGLDFHRVLEDFIIQSGDTNGYGGQSVWGNGFAAECSDLLHHYNGALAMAGIEANHSQFFVVCCPQDSVPQTVQEQMRTEGWSEDVIDAYARIGGAPYLDNVHTVFGQVFDGMETVLEINRSAAAESDAVALESVRILTFAEWQAAHPDAEPAFYTAADPQQ